MSQTCIGLTWHMVESNLGDSFEYTSGKNHFDTQKSSGIIGTASWLHLITVSHAQPKQAQVI